MTSLPLGLFELNESLEKLDISNNKISKIPSDVGKLSKIKWLLMQNNPIA